MVNLLKSITQDPRVKQLGPGLTTGAADDDPSGIATYSQAGAQFGYSMLWTVLFTYPLMVGIQMVSALGCITGRGLAANVKAAFPRSVLYGIVGLLLIANTINIAADIAAMGEALRLLLGGSAAYAVTESFDWQSGLDMKLHEALEFYGIIAIATVGGVALNFTHLDPMRALVWSAEINGVIAVPIMAIMMLLASREDIMGQFVIRPRLRRLGWIATAVMGVTVVAMVATT